MRGVDPTSFLPDTIYEDGREASRENECPEFFHVPDIALGLARRRGTAHRMRDQLLNSQDCPRQTVGGAEMAEFEICLCCAGLGTLHT